jgi:hypothetical protein
MARYARRQREIANARQVQESILVLTSEGEKMAAAGDWIVNDGSGQFHLFKPEAFEEMYEPMDGPNPEVT